MGKKIDLNKFFETNPDYQHEIDRLREFLGELVPVNKLLEFMQFNMLLCEKYSDKYSHKPVLRWSDLFCRICTYIRYTGTVHLFTGKWYKSMWKNGNLLRSKPVEVNTQLSRAWWKAREMVQNDMQ